MGVGFAAAACQDAVAAELELLRNSAQPNVAVASTAKNAPVTAIADLTLSFLIPRILPMDRNRPYLLKLGGRPRSLRGGRHTRVIRRTGE